MAPHAHSTAPDQGTVLADRYRLDRRIARGGMAEVFEAHDEVLGRRVAVKVFRSAEAAHRDRFDAEVRLLAGLSHPGLVAVYDAGEHGGDGFMVLELVEGPTLRRTLDERAPLPATEVAALGATLADALAHVHDRGIVHRDLTPANVLCGPDGTPRLTDFGIARLLDTTRITAEHLTIGTVGYMAPEQVEGGEVTPAADVYALGLVLLEALTGSPAFSGPSHEVAVARLTRDPDVPHGLAEPWPALLRAMTARRPHDRPSATAVAEALRAGGADPLRSALAVAAMAPPPPPAGPEPGAPSERASNGRSVVVPSDDGAETDLEAATAALPVSETGADPARVVPGAAPTRTTVMPAVLLPTPPVADEPSPVDADVPGQPADRGERAPDDQGRPAPAVAAVAGVSGALGEAGGRLGRWARQRSFHQWLAIAAAAVFVLAVWQSGDGTWSRQVAALQAAAEADQAEAPPPTTEAPTTTVAPAPPPAPPDDADDEGPSEGRAEGKGQGKGQGKGKKDDD
ncbi:MAG: serine/threonine-protein kinase [Actinomycetota bacterium]